MNAKTHYSAVELVDLPGMPKWATATIESKIRSIQHLATKEKWDFIVLPGRGGPRGYALTSLPHATQRHLKLKQAAEDLANLPAVRTAAAPPAVIETAPLPALATLTRHQVAVMDARIWFMRLIEQRPANCSIKPAMVEIINEINAGDQIYSVMAAAANDRRGKGRTLAKRTLMAWWSLWVNSGKNPAALAPNDADARRVKRDALLVDWVRAYRPHSLLTAPAELPPWLPYLLDEYRRPTEPSLADSLRQVKLPAAIPRPSYDQANSLWQKIPVIYLERGRKTGAEYGALLPFTRRDWSMEEPFNCGQIDGHSFKAYVAHPVTGAHFHPEVCGVICMLSKYLTGFSVGMAESWRTVSDAFRHACTIDPETGKLGGVFSRIEADRGAGNMAIKNADKLIGIFARAGTELVIPERGGNPQGHGGVERSNQSVWIRAAKSLVTYTGKDMDRVARKKVYTRLESDLKAAIKDKNLGQLQKTSELLLSWREFLEFLEKKVWEYNNTPHSAHPKITDQKTGRRRHMTPTEVVLDHSARGWQPVTVGEELLPYLFMPHERIKKIERGEFNLHGNRYFSWDLAKYQGQPMIAAYDVHDAHKVWVLTPDQQPVCQAEWNGNRVLGRPETAKQLEDRKREEGRVARKEKDLRMIKAETDRSIEISAEAMAEAEIVFEQLTTPKVANVITLSRKRPIFTTDYDKYQWLQANIDQQTEADSGWLECYTNTTEYKLMFGEDNAAYM